MRHRLTLTGTGGLLLGLGAYCALAWLGPPSLGRRIFGPASAETQSVQQDTLPTSLCIARADAPALRAWISEHPKSKRGRLDHQRRLQVAE